MVELSDVAGGVAVCCEKCLSVHMRRDKWSVFVCTALRSREKCTETDKTVPLSWLVGTAFFWLVFYTNKYNLKLFFDFTHLATHITQCAGYQENSNNLLDN